MSAPIEPPEGYAFINSAVGPFSWDDPNQSSQIYWPDESDRNRVVVVHQACGCFVSMANVETHDAWHASLSA
ncbi:hypothetical protein [Actinophytocola sp.]|uniref:hypothetical protein n=1 Tax=Actinophytocola sp. TaxID=1872138 RepID=UPI002D7E8548|nr:hypothetical protein [Actinophytocola sp.]HET9144147.1 hypothetical protein [Actinophytocola sp.]